MSEPRNYDDEEVEAILRRALEQQLDDGQKLGHDDLIAAAREVGLDDASVARAIGEIEAERSALAIRDRLRKDRRSSWTQHFMTFLTIAGGLVLLNVLGLAGAWTLWIAIVWGMLVTLHAFRGFRATTDRELEREQHRLNRHARRKAQAEARREAYRRRQEELERREAARRSRKDAGGELERVIEEGVSLLLNAAANKLRQTNEDMQRAPRTEFERYVSQRKAAARGEAPAPPREAPRVRVEPVDDADEEEESPRSRRRSSRKR